MEPSQPSWFVERIDDLLVIIHHNDTLAIILACLWYIVKLGSPKYMFRLIGIHEVLFIHTKGLGSFAFLILMILAFSLFTRFGIFFII